VRHGGNRLTDATLHRISQSQLNHNCSHRIRYFHPCSLRCDDRDGAPYTSLSAHVTNRAAATRERSVDASAITITLDGFRTGCCRFRDCGDCLRARSYGLGTERAEVHCAVTVRCTVHDGPEQLATQNVARSEQHLSRT
jgi:hypothetical protein